MTLTFGMFLCKNQLFTVYIFDKEGKMADFKFGSYSEWLYEGSLQRSNIKDSPAQKLNIFHQHFSNSFFLRTVPVRLHLFFQDYIKIK